MPEAATKSKSPTPKFPLAESDKKKIVRLLGSREFLPQVKSAILREVWRRREVEPSIPKPSDLQAQARTIEARAAIFRNHLARLSEELWWFAEVAGFEGKVTLMKGLEDFIRAAGEIPQHEALNVPKKGRKNWGTRVFVHQLASIWRKAHGEWPTQKFDRKKKKWAGPFHDFARLCCKPFNPSGTGLEEEIKETFFRIGKIPREAGKGVKRPPQARTGK